MNVPQLRVLGVGEMLDVALKIYWRNAWTLFRLVVLIVAPVSVLTTLLTLSATPLEEDFVIIDEMTGEPTLADDFGTSIGTVLAGFGLANEDLASAVSLLAGLAYFAYFEGGPTGQTIGKRVVGIRVYDFRQGGPIGYGRALLRYIGRIVSAIPCLLGYLWMLWDGEKQTWHDKIAGTVVVPVADYPVND